jgi:beta-glucosidase
MTWYERPELQFAVGIEDTFVPQTRTGERALDEYELTQHNHFWHSDLSLAKASGATMVRWGIPWYRVNPAKDTWDWSWLDRVVDRFDELGLECMVDLMHYGTPTWLENEFANHDYPARVAEYAYRVAERYRGRFNVFTPLNEPLLNVMYCGEFGYWPPYLRGHDGFVQIARSISRGIVQTQHAVAEASGGDATFVHVEASFRFTGEDDDSRAEAEHLRHRAYLVEDLVTGKVDADHPLAEYLLRNGFGETNLEWARANVAIPDVMGVNYYPALSTEEFVRGDSHSGGPLDPRPRKNEWTTGLKDVLTSYAQRYGRPVFLTETCLTGSVADRLDWLDASVAAVHELRADGVPVVGYTWWAVFDMMEWTYRGGVQPPEAYLLPMGLWDLKLDGAGVYQRVRNPVADRYHQHASAAAFASQDRPR